MLLHMSQALFYALAWNAHRQALGAAQFLLATGVLLKEGVYMLLVLLAQYHSVNYLEVTNTRHGAGDGEEEQGREFWARLLYVFAPDVHILLELHSAFWRTAWGSTLEMLGVVSPLGGACALLALVCALWREGGLPALPLCMGYMHAMLGACTMLCAKTD